MTERPRKKRAAKKTAAKRTASKKTAARRPRRSLPPQIREMAERNHEFLRILIYGPPGSGKTVIAGSGGPRTLVLESDRGEASAIKAGSTAMKWPLTDWSDLEEALDYLAADGREDFDMVWLDSVTHFQERGLDHIMADVVSDPKKSHRRDYLPDKGEYGANMNRLSSRLRRMRDLPMHVGLVCHSHREVWQEEYDRTVQMPYVQGKDMSEKVCGYVDVVGHTRLIKKDGKTQGTLDCTPSDHWYTKDRYGIGKMLNPTVPKILKKVNGGNNPNDSEGAKQ